MCGMVGIVNFRDDIGHRELLLKEMVKTLEKRRT